MTDNFDPSTRELLAESEKLRSEKKAKVPATRQLVAQSERLIGREPSTRGGLGRTLALVGIIVALVALCGYLFWLDV